LRLTKSHAKTPAAIRYKTYCEKKIIRKLNIWLCNKTFADATASNGGTLGSIARGRRPHNGILALSLIIAQGIRVGALGL